MEDAEAISALLDLMAYAPGLEAADVCNLMGWPINLPDGADHDEAEAWKDTVWGRWRALPMRKRLDTEALYRRKWAEAMLRCAATPTPREPGKGRS